MNPGKSSTTARATTPTPDTIKMYTDTCGSVIMVITTYTGVNKVLNYNNMAMGYTSGTKIWSHLIESQLHLSSRGGSVETYILGATYLVPSGYLIEAAR